MITIMERRQPTVVKCLKLNGIDYRIEYDFQFRVNKYQSLRLIYHTCDDCKFLKFHNWQKKQQGVGI